MSQSIIKARKLDKGAITPDRFLAVLEEMLDENAFAMRAVLRILVVEFTEEVPTLAVTLEERPRLLVNLAFVNSNCRTEAHVKAVICHEFLHVLLGHTERFQTMTPLLNVALDAVINAIIHRTLGPEYSSMMATYYADVPGQRPDPLRRLLRPPSNEEQNEPRYMEHHHLFEGAKRVYGVWLGLYKGLLVADDILEVAEDLSKDSSKRPIPPLIGNHDAVGSHESDVPEVLQEALNQAMRQMNGDGIWRSPKERGVGANPREALVSAAQPDAVIQWRRAAMAAILECITPDPKARITEALERCTLLPVMSTADRRSFLRTLWSPLIPNAEWSSSYRKPRGSANVYLDVSGSMSGEMPEIIALLGRLSHAIRRPFWAFSTEIAPAEIVRGQLKTSTTGGTSMNCVLEHILKTSPEAALVVTDGYIETVDRALLRRIQSTRQGGVRIAALVTRDGSPNELRKAGIRYRQLGALPVRSR